MKKLLIVLMLTLSATFANAATLYYNATDIACSINGSPCSDWYTVNCFFVINQNTRQVIIDSDISYNQSTNTFCIDRKSRQIIDYGTAETSYGTNSQGYGYRLEEMQGNDIHGHNCILHFFVFNDGDLMFIITYNDVSYKYMLTRQ